MVDADEYYNPGDLIVVDLDPAEGAEVHLDPVAGGTSPSRRHTVAGFEGPRRAVSHRRLLSLLRTLVRDPRFAASGTGVAVPGMEVLPAYRFFVHFNQVERGEHENKARGYWGTVVDARRPDPTGPLWLNAGNRSEPSVRIPAEHAQTVLHEAGVSDPEDLAGAHVLALGTYRVSQTSKQVVWMASAVELALVVNH